MEVGMKGEREGERKYVQREGHNANLHLWGEKASDTCPLCHADKQNLVHVLNLCQVALNLRR